MIDPEGLLDHLDNSTTQGWSSLTLNVDIANDDEYQTAQQNIQKSSFNKKYWALHTKLCGILKDFNLVSFVPLDIMDATNMVWLLANIDTPNRYFFLSKPGRDHGHCNNKDYKMKDIFGCTIQADQSKSMYESITDM